MKIDKTLYHNIQLKNVQLVGINCYLNEKFDTVTDLNTPLNIKVDNDSQVISDTRGITYLKVRIEFDKKDNELFYIEVKYRGLCEAIKPVKENEMKFYLKIQSVPMLWAYVRETINNVMLKMGLPAIVLPAVNINEMIEIISKEKKDTEE